MVFKNYKWAVGSRFKVNAQAAGEEIDRLRGENGGSVSAPIVVAAASDEASVLHNAFEWNDEKAANEHRLAQARSLLRSVVVVVEDDERMTTHEVRAFVKYEPTDKPAGAKNVYTHVKTAMETPEIREQLVERAWEELTSWRLRYEKLREFSDIFAAIDDVRRSAA